MRVMFRFEKGPQVRFISHLDLLRAMQRALLRAGLPLVWSQGFHPHPEFSFAMALPVGAESTGEYMEAGITGCTAREAAVRLGASLPPGLRILDAGELPEDAPSLMAAVTASDWTLQAPEGLRADALKALMRRREIPVKKTGRDGSRIVDIRPGILLLALADTSAGRFVHARLSAGSRDNVSPFLLYQAMLPGEDTAALRICRRELYFEKNRELRPLIELACKEGW